MVTKTTASRRKPAHDPRDDLIKSLLEARYAADHAARMGYTV